MDPDPGGQKSEEKSSFEVPDVIFRKMTASPVA
jgi:hypothetical protein